MTEKPGFDVTAAHKHFSAQCFNMAWGLIDKPDRTPEEDEQMICLSLASLWHWTQREDCTRRNMSIGYWQASRIYALVGQAEFARKYGLLSLEYSTEKEPFYMGYAYEALARAESVAGNREKMEEHLVKARGLVENISDVESRKILLADLDGIK